MNKVRTELQELMDLIPLEQIAEAEKLITSMCGKSFANQKKIYFTGIKGIKIIIDKVTMQVFDKSLDDVAVKSREDELATPRMIGMAVLAKFTKVPFNIIGDMYGGRDHATVSYAVKEVGEKLQIKDAKIVEYYTEFKEKFLNETKTKEAA